MKWFKVFSKDILSGPDFLKQVHISGKRVCVVKAEGKIFAVQNRCPHAGADLSKGWCRNGNIVCPYHRHEFNLETGRGKASQGNYIQTYPVEVRADGVYVGVKKAWWKFW
ncbi:MAG: Rieske 2Fe-2S domain-containing protein [Daejeonella sp.]